MTLTIKRQLDSICKRINKLNLDNMQLILEENIVIGEPTEIYFIVKVLDRYNNIVEQSDKIYDAPRVIIQEYADKYNLDPKLEFKKYETNKDSDIKVEIVE